MCAYLCCCFVFLCMPVSHTHKCVNTHKCVHTSAFAAVSLYVYIPYSYTCTHKCCCFLLYVSIPFSYMCTHKCCSCLSLYVSILHAYMCTHKCCSCLSLYVTIPYANKCPQEQLNIQNIKHVITDTKTAVLQKSISKIHLWILLMCTHIYEFIEKFMWTQTQRQRYFGNQYRKFIYDFFLQINIENWYICVLINVWVFTCSYVWKHKHNDIYLLIDGCCCSWQAAVAVDSAVAVDRLLLQYTAWDCVIVKSKFLSRRRNFQFFIQKNTCTYISHYHVISKKIHMYIYMFHYLAISKTTKNSLSRKLSEPYISLSSISYRYYTCMHMCIHECTHI